MNDIFFISHFHRGKRQARACLARMLAWQPQRVVFAHGRWYPDHAMAELRRAFRWLD